MLVPLVLAVLLSYCLSPIVDIAERRAHFPHGRAHAPACNPSPLPPHRPLPSHCRPPHIPPSPTPHLPRIPHRMAVTLALVVGLSALCLFLVVVSVAAHDIVGKARQYEAYVIALSNRFAQAHSRAQQQLATSRIAAKARGKGRGDAGSPRSRPGPDPF